MKAYKSGKQRRAEICAARAAKRLRRPAPAAQPVQAPRPRGTAPVAPGQLRPHNSYGEPDFVRRGYYEDLPFRCVDCGAEGVWTAVRQKWWYEVAKGDVFTTALRCAACRAKERLRKEAARRAHQEGLLAKRAAKHRLAPLPFG